MRSVSSSDEMATSRITSAISAHIDVESSLKSYKEIMMKIDNKMEMTIGQGLSFARMA